MSNWFRVHRRRDRGLSYRRTGGLAERVPISIYSVNIFINLIVIYNGGLPGDRPSFELQTIPRIVVDSQNLG